MSSYLFQVICHLTHSLDPSPKQNEYPLLNVSRTEGIHKGGHLFIKSSADLKEQKGSMPTIFCINISPVANIMCHWGPLLLI